MMGAAGAVASAPPGAVCIKVRCRDAYEALKLATLACPRDKRAREGGAFADEVVSAYGEEIVLSLRDGSAHSVVLSDAGQAEALADFMQSVADGEHAIAMAEASAGSVRLAKSPAQGADAGAPRSAAAGAGGRGQAATLH